MSFCGRERHSWHAACAGKYGGDFCLGFLFYTMLAVATHMDSAHVHGALLLLGCLSGGFNAGQDVASGTVSLKGLK